MKKHPTKSESSLEFHAKDFYHQPKNSFWYLGVAILLAALLVLALSSREYLLSAVIVAAGVAIFRLGNLQPGARQIKLTKRGLYWGDRFFGYHQLRSFWFAKRAGQVTLYLERLNLAPVLSFVIPENQLEKAALFLSHQLPHHHHKGEPFGDRFSRLLGI